MPTLQEATGQEQIRSGLYAGGSGSGCNPEEAKKHGKRCGRPSSGKRGGKSKAKTPLSKKLKKTISQNHVIPSHKFTLVKGKRSKAELAEARQRLRVLQGVERQFKEAKEGENFLEVVKDSVEDGLAYAWENIAKQIITPAFVDSLILAERARKKNNWGQAVAWTATTIGLLLLQGGWYAKPLTKFGGKALKLGSKYGKPVSMKLLKQLAKHNKAFRVAIRRSKLGRRAFKVAQRAPARVVMRPGGRRRGFVRAPGGRTI